jgi:two-component system, OmpR family, response regulator MprA
MANRPPVSNPSATESTSSILVVDDDPEVRRVIQLALEEEGWAVDAAGDGQQAVEQASRHRPRLVVLDMGLPRLDGDGVAARLHAMYGDTVPILIITADGHAGDKARRVGARAHLSKPFELDDLCAAVQQALDGG